jgi:hypothetical protein
MRRFLLVFIAFFVLCTTEAASRHSFFKGAWSSNSAGAVITDSICIFCYRAGRTLQALLEVPSADIS